MTESGKATSCKEKANWNAVLRGDRDAFQRMVTPHVAELLKAAQRELRYRIALGDIDADDLTPAEIVGEALSRAWRERRHRPPEVGMRAWLLAEVLEAAEIVIRREAREKRELTTTSLEDPVPIEPIHNYEEPFELAEREEVLNVSSTEFEDAAANEQRVYALPIRLRQVFIMHELHQVPLREVAVLVHISEDEAAHLLADARNRLGAAIGSVS